MSPDTGVLHANRLIASLSSKDRQYLLAGCELIQLIFAEVLSEPGEPVRHIYFPTDSFISMVRRVDSNSSLEVALIGDEGMHGIGLVLGVDVSPLHALVQGGGSALRMDAEPFRRNLQQSPTLRRVLHRYIYVRMAQLAQTAACNRFHVVEARLARWLLMTRDRAHSDELRITHEFLALMLGVRRVGVTVAAGALQKRKLINYSRGIIIILDLDGLEDAACACYQDDKASYDRIMN